MTINPFYAEYMYALPSSPIFHFIGIISVVSRYFQSKLKTLCGSWSDGFVRSHLTFIYSVSEKDKFRFSRSRLILYVHSSFANIYTYCLYVMSILFLQSSWWGRESWLLCLVCLPGVSWWLCGFPRGAMGLSAVCDCGISWSYVLIIFNITMLDNFITLLHSSPI